MRRIAFALLVLGLGHAWVPPAAGEPVARAMEPATMAANVPGAGQGVTRTLAAAPASAIDAAEAKPGKARPVQARAAQESRGGALLLAAAVAAAVIAWRRTRPG